MMKLRLWRLKKLTMQEVFSFSYPPINWFRAPPRAKVKCYCQFFQFRFFNSRKLIIPGRAKVKKYRRKGFGKHCSCPMEFLQFPYSSPWNYYGLPIVVLWIPYGFPIGSLWVASGFPKFPNLFLWISNGCPTVFLWLPYRFPMDSLLLKDSLREGQTDRIVQNGQGMDRYCKSRPSCRGGGRSCRGCTFAEYRATGILKHFLVGVEKLQGGVAFFKGCNKSPGI